MVEEKAFLLCPRLGQLEVSVRRKILYFQAQNRHMRFIMQFDMKLDKKTHIFW